MENRRPNAPKSYPKADKKVKLFDFGQLQAALVGYLANLDMRLNNIMSGDVPVVCQGLDVGYYQRLKYEKISEKDIYQQTPRVNVKFEDSSDNRDQNGSQEVRARYIFNNKTYEAFFRRRTKMMTVVNSFVAANYVRALEYYEVVESMMGVSVPYTYEHLGLTHEGAYDITANIINYPGTDPSSTPKDFVINFTMDLQIHLWAIDYDSIQEIKVFSASGPDEGDGFIGGDGKTEGGNKIRFVINSKSPDGQNHYSDFEAPHNPACLGCMECLLD